MIEYWSPDDYQLSKDERHFASMMDTDLFALARGKSTAWTLAVAPDGSRFALFCSDQKIRVFKFLEGKLSRTYDETLASAQDLQRSGGGEYKC